MEMSTVQLLKLALKIKPVVRYLPGLGRWYSPEGSLHVETGWNSKLYFLPPVELRDDQNGDFRPDITMPGEYFRDFSAKAKPKYAVQNAEYVRYGDKLPIFYNKFLKRSAYPDIESILKQLPSALIENEHVNAFELVGAPDTGIVLNPANLKSCRLAFVKLYKLEIPPEVERQNVIFNYKTFTAQQIENLKEGDLD